MNLDLSDYRVLVARVQDPDQMFLLQELVDIAEFETEQERQRTIDFIRTKLISLNIIKL